jgi:hypothetical protein
VFLSGFSDSYSERKAGSIPYNLIKLFSSLMKAKEDKLECFFLVILSGLSSVSKVGSIPYNLVKLFFIFSNGGKNKLECFFMVFLTCVVRVRLGAYTKIL